MEKYNTDNVMDNLYQRLQRLEPKIEAPGTRDDLD